MYSRKTKYKYFIALYVGFNGIRQEMKWNFETEEDCNKKLAKLNAKVEASRNNPILDPFSQFNRWIKYRKRVPI